MKPSSKHAARSPGAAPPVPPWKRGARPSGPRKQLEFEAPHQPDEEDEPCDIEELGLDSDEFAYESGAAGDTWGHGVDFARGAGQGECLVPGPYAWASDEAGESSRPESLDTDSDDVRSGRSDDDSPEIAWDRPSFTNSGRTRWRQRPAASGNYRQAEDDKAQNWERTWEESQAARKRLPIHEKRSDVIPVLCGSSPVCCILGETGCGKSTQIPQFILEEAWAQGQNVRIAVTQPRRVAALNLASRVGYELGLGAEAVGYRIGGESKPGQYIDLCTVGYMLQLLINNPGDLGRYTHIVLDEVHERSAESDLLCLVVKLLVEGWHRDVRIVVMSATLQSDIFADYFARLVTGVPEKIHVGARCFPVREHFLDELETAQGIRLRSSRNQIWKRIKEAFPAESPKRIDTRHCEKMQPIIVDLVQAIAEKGSTILVFLPGIAEISSLWEDLKVVEDGGTVRIFPLHSMIPREEQEMVFKDPDPSSTNVVLSTDIAESSVTLPRVVAVIDLGLHRRLSHDEQRGMSALETKWISRASATQRSGRAGRTQPGICLRLYTKAFFDNTMAPFDPPESSTMPLDKLYLQAKQLSDKMARVFKGRGPQTAQSIIQELIQAPDLSAIEGARLTNAEIGTITKAEESARLTDLGTLCLQLPVSIRLTRLVWLGVLWGVAADAVVLACAMSTNDPFSAPSTIFIRSENDFLDRLQASTSSRLLFDAGLLSEPLMVRQLFLEWLVQLHKAEWIWGSKEYILRARRRHTWDFSWKFSLHRGRMEHLVSHVLDLALRTLRACDLHSKASSQLRGLISGLGYNVNDRGDLSPISKDSYKEFNWRGIFDDNPAFLKSLLAAAFSDHLLVGTYSSCRGGAKLAEKELVLKAMKDLGLAAQRTVTFTGAMKDAGRYVETICGSAPQRVVTFPEGATGEKVVWTFVEFQLVEGSRWEKLESQSCKTPAKAFDEQQKCWLAPDFNLLYQVEKGIKDLQKSGPNALAEWSIGSHTSTHPCLLHWEWMRHIVGAKKGQSLRCEAFCDRRNALGCVGHVPQLPAEETGPTSLLPVALFAVSSSMRGGDDLTRIYPEGVTLLAPGHLLFVLATAAIGEVQSGLHQFGFTMDGSIGILRKGINLPDKCFSPERWELVRKLREEIREQLTAVPPDTDTSVEWMRSGDRVLLRDTPVEALVRELLPAAEGSSDTAMERREPVLNTSVVSLVGSESDVHALQPLASWKQLLARSEEQMKRKRAAGIAAETASKQPKTMGPGMMGNGFGGPMGPCGGPMGPCPGMMGPPAGGKGFDGWAPPRSLWPMPPYQMWCKGGPPCSSKGAEKAAASRPKSVFFPKSVYPVLSGTPQESICKLVDKLSGCKDALRFESDRARVVNILAKICEERLPFARVMTRWFKQKLDAFRQAPLAGSQVEASDNHVMLQKILSDLEQQVSKLIQPAETSAEPSADPGPFFVGAYVELHGLKAAERNGLCGHCLEWKSDRGRWVIQFVESDMFDSDTLLSLAIKPENMMMLTAQEV